MAGMRPDLAAECDLFYVDILQLSLLLFCFVVLGNWLIIS